MIGGDKNRPGRVAGSLAGQDQRISTAARAADDRNFGKAAKGCLHHNRAIILLQQELSGAFKAASE